MFCAFSSLSNMSWYWGAKALIFEFIWLKNRVIWLFNRVVKLIMLALVHLSLWFFLLKENQLSQIGWFVISSCLNLIDEFGSPICFLTVSFCHFLFCFGNQLFKITLFSMIFIVLICKWPSACIESCLLYLLLVVSYFSFDVVAKTGYDS